MQQVRITDLMDRDRVDLDCRITSKKRLMEHIASMLARGTGVDEQSVFRVLIERERLGSTGVGDGVALPHGRMAGIDDAALALATLSEPLDYQSRTTRMCGSWSACWSRKTPTRPTFNCWQTWHNS
jgi:nitrogen PTS system EIIA component